MLNVLNKRLGANVLQAWRDRASAFSSRVSFVHAQCDTRSPPHSNAEFIVKILNISYQNLDKLLNQRLRCSDHSSDQHGEGTDLDLLMSFPQKMLMKKVNDDKNELGFDYCALPIWH